MASTPWLESSDYVARYQVLDANKVVGSNNLPSALPPQVTDRLASLGLTWADLPLLARHAVLWDAGFVRVNDGSDAMQQVYTPCDADGKTGSTMENIQISKDVFLASEPTATVTDCNGTARQANSNGLNLERVVKCAMNNNTSLNVYSSMWAQDGLGITVAPLLTVGRHEWKSNGKPSFLLFAIHSVPDIYTDETAWGVCPVGHPGSLIIPCRVHTGSDNMCPPAPSSRMNAWLDAIAKTKQLASSSSSSPDASSSSTSSSLSAGAIVGIVLGSLAGLALLLLAFFWIRQRRRRLHASMTTTSMDRSVAGTYSTLPPGHTTSNTTAFGTATSGNVRSQHHQAIQTNSHKLNAFQRDPFLCARRLPYASIQTSRLISRGAYGEVWLGTLDGDVVAVKKILDLKRNDEVELECFADEIRLLATLHHPHIVQFKGFAWNTLQNLCFVVEFMQHGDLSTFLAEHKDDVNWNTKLIMAIGIARALAYLHAQTPKIIHRDLKAKNVLVTDDLHAKVSDFGISRERASDATMTAGVGTVYWTAPEVLNGDRYSELADVYSFGCVLNEMDTHEIPYAHLKGVPPMTVVQRVTTQGLRPEFTAKCPKLVKDLADQCLLADPRSRPTAAQIVNMIEMWKGW
ncbi:Aste57867_23678 [Aphanomyces stellatus]|uniref:Aste57867_23678 protein n=1 Tax=Aphanomyces stellatus TaxID=120398 RepID=A0A485LNI4_9STRA|nr:hypothetical protein As57867_023606 [Aphanomyces stellatus]VFU00323.1 Aste57867_23678 [Aphanomyces stellatus]